MQRQFTLKNSSIFLLLVVLLTTSNQGISQDSNFEAISIGFYNVENLFDTENDTLISDEEFLPDGSKAWTKEKYDEKVANIASVISQLGKELCKDGVSLIGICEVENEKVLLDDIPEMSSYILDS